GGGGGRGGGGGGAAGRGGDARLLVRRPRRHLAAGGRLHAADGSCHRAPARRGHRAARPIHAGAAAPAPAANPTRRSIMTARESERNPFLQGNFGPWRMEGDAPDLEVIGTIPRELN